MSSLQRAAEPEMTADTVWVEEVSWIDRVPHSISMLFVGLTSAYIARRLV